MVVASAAPGISPIYRPNSSRSNTTLSVTRTRLPSLGNVADKEANPFASPPPAAVPKPPFYKRRWFIISVVGACLSIALLFIILFPVVKAVIQSLVGKTSVDITAASISSPTNNSFQLSMQGTVAHAGIFSAVISFPSPVNVSWMDSSTKVPLGYMQLSTLYANNKRATINDSTTFYITDQDAFGRFTSAMITSQNFTWELESYDLSVQAGKFPTARGISFNKMVTINGTNNFAGNVQVEDLHLSGFNLTSSGIDFVTVTQLNNPSPFALDLGTVVFDLSYQDVYLGSSTGMNTQLSPGNNNVTLNGVLIPQFTPSYFAVVAQFISNLLNNQSSPVLATGKSATQSDGTVISWINQGIESLTMTIPFQSATLM